MQEDDRRLRSQHMMVDGDNVQLVGAQRLENRIDFALAHGDVTGDLGVGLVAGEGGPGVEAHARVDGGIMLFEVEVIAAQSEFVNGAESFALLTNDFVERGEIKCRSGSSGGRGRSRRLRNEVESRLDVARKGQGVAVSVDVHEVHARLIKEKMIVKSSDLDAVIE